MGYADELFEMRVNTKEMKQYKRNMVSSQKFTFQKQHVTCPREPDDCDINDETMTYYMSCIKKNHLSVNWEYLDTIQRTKNLRRINLFLEKQDITNQTNVSLHNSLKKRHPTFLPLVLEEQEDVNFDSAFNRDNINTEKYEIQALMKDFI